MECGKEKQRAESIKHSVWENWNDEGGSRNGEEGIGKGECGMWNVERKSIAHSTQEIRFQPSR